MSWKPPYIGQVVRHVNDLGKHWPAIVLEVVDAKKGTLDLCVLAGQQGPVFVKGAAPATGDGGWQPCARVLEDGQVLMLD